MLEAKLNFSILISLYAGERADYLRLSLESLRVQTLPPDEVVLVHDGPITPELQEVVAEYMEKLPLRPVYIEQNSGLSHALNAGLKECRNEWVARMDTDDISKPHRLAVLAREIHLHPEADIIGSYARRINEHGKRGGEIHMPSNHETIRKYIWTCPMIHPSVCYKKDKILAVGGYNPDAGPRQDDYELWFRCAKAGYVFHNVPELLIQYRFTRDNIRKNNFRVGLARFKQGIKGNKMLGFGPVAYIGVFVPLFRSMLPYPLNIWFQKLLNNINPRHMVEKEEDVNNPG